MWITYSAWRLEHGSDVLAASEDPRPKLEAAVRHLDGLALQSVDIVSPSLDALFAFEKGVTLRIFPIYSEQYEHWKLFTPNGQVLVVGPGTTWSYKSASTS